MLLNAGHLDKMFPAIIRGKSVLAPIKIDLIHGGARCVDSFCWDIYSTLVSPDEFSARLCSDLNLHPAFQPKIALQIAEQVESYNTIASLIKMALRNDILPNSHKIREKVLMNITVRQNTIEYSDKFFWDPMCSELTPEQFARITCADLGLPAEMEAVISFKIRETLFRNMITWLDEPKSAEMLPTIPDSQVPKASETKISLVTAVQAVDMATNLWKRAKPASIEDQIYTPMPFLPADRDTNASIWR